METAEKIFEELEEYTDQLLEQLKEIREKLEQEDRLFQEKFPESHCRVLLEYVDLMTKYLEGNRTLLKKIIGESGRCRRDDTGERMQLLEQRADLRDSCGKIGHIWERIKEAAVGEIDEKRTESLLRNYLGACREMDRNLWQRISEYYNKGCNLEAPERMPLPASAERTLSEQRLTPDRRTGKEKVCPHCGRSVPEESMFCGCCGVRLSKTSANASCFDGEARSAARYDREKSDYWYRQARTGSPGPGDWEKLERTGGSYKGEPASSMLPSSAGPGKKHHGFGILDSLKKIFSRDKKETQVKTSERKKAEKEELKQNRRPDPDSPNIVMDEVQFKAAAPAQIETGSSFELKLYMYLQEEKALVSELLQEFNTPTAAATSGIFEVARHQELRVTVQSEDVEIKEKTARLLWNGRLALCSFLLYLPEAFAKKQAIVQARVYSGIMVLADLRLILKVKGNEPQNLDIPVEMRRIRSAFASYSSKDRARVVARLQGMQAVNPELDLFFDRESLRTGEHWEERLFREIETRDILYLFWSRSAAASRWVNKEWHHALETGGENAVEPVPLEPPEICPPPEELRGLHFDNWALRYTQAND